MTYTKLLSRKKTGYCLPKAIAGLFIFVIIQ